MININASDEDAPIGMSGVMERNIRTVLARRRSEVQRQPLQLRLADAITRFTGSMRFVYIHLALFAA